MTHPIDAVIVTNVRSDKVNFRDFIKERMALSLNTASEIQGLVLTDVVHVIMGGVVFGWDGADTTSPHDGVFCLVDGSTPGRRYKVSPNPLQPYPYLENVWTPGMTFNNSAAGITYSLQQGSYTRVGRLVTVTGRIILTNNGSGVGAARITGLPFVCNGFYHVGRGTLATGGSAATGIFPRVEPGSSEMLLLIPGAAADAVASDVNCTNTFDFIFTATYMT